MPLAVDVLLPLPLEPLQYLVPFGMEPGPVGARVVVPWQGGARIGLAVAVDRVSAARALELKEVVGWLDDAPYVWANAVPALAELASYCGAPSGVVLATLLPGGFRDEVRWSVRAVEGAAVDGLDPGAWRDARELDPGALDLWRRQGLVHERVAKIEPSESVLAFVRPADEGLEGAQRANQRTALERLHDEGPFESAAALARAAGVPDSSVRLLVEKGYARYQERPLPPPALPMVTPREGLPGRAPQAPLADVVAVGGGRREERLAALVPALAGDLERGRSPLVLVPEQRFLDETAGLLARRHPVLTLSGDLEDRVRDRVWAEVGTGNPAIVVGTWTALLAPRPQPGRIVVLEASASTYKVPSGARLWVPEAARRLAAAAGSAFACADVLPGPEVRERVPAEATLALPLPRLRAHVADLGNGAGWPIAHDLARVLRQVADRDRQAVVLAPRRGFSGAFGCTDCGWVSECPNCDLALRYHQRDRRLRCHQCGHEAPPPELCSSCGSVDLAPLRGAGTEWMAAAVRKLVPDIAVLRHDGDHRDDLAGLYAGEPGVVVGTTALLRLERFPALSLAAVALFDTHVSVSDFRADEEALRTLLQLADLAADRVPLMVVQTYQPGHPVLRVITADDPDEAAAAFIAEVGERRRRFGYPPATHLAKIQVSSRDRAAAERAARTAVDRLRTGGASDHELVGPSPAAVSRVRGQHTYQLLVRSASEARFRELLRGVDGSARGVRVRIDVDPRDVGAFLE